MSVLNQLNNKSVSLLCTSKKYCKISVSIKMFLSLSNKAKKSGKKGEAEKKRNPEV